MKNSNIVDDSKINKIHQYINLLDKADKMTIHEVYEKLFMFCVVNKNLPVNSFQNVKKLLNMLDDKEKYQVLKTMVFFNDEYVPKLNSDEFQNYYLQKYKSATQKEKDKIINDLSDLFIACTYISFADDCDSWPNPEECIKAILRSIPRGSLQEKLCDVEERISKIFGETEIAVPFSYIDPKKSNNKKIQQKQFIDQQDGDGNSGTQEIQEKKYLFEDIKEKAIYIKKDFLYKCKNMHLDEAEIIYQRFQQFIIGKKILPEIEDFLVFFYDVDDFVYKTNINILSIMLNIINNFNEEVQKDNYILLYKNFAKHRQVKIASELLSDPERKLVFTEEELVECLGKYKLDKLDSIFYHEN